jgi:hypothetical protein
MMADLGSSAKIVQDDLPESSDLDTEILIEKETTIEATQPSVVMKSIVCRDQAKREW